MKARPRLIILLITFLSVVRLSAASTIQFAVSTIIVPENAGPAVIEVRRSGEDNTVDTVDFATADGSAVAGVKYTAVTGMLTFAAGETNKTIVVPILNDGAVQGNQDFQVMLSNPTGGAVLGDRPTATVRITDNDKGLQFEFASYSVLKTPASSWSA